MLGHHTTRRMTKVRPSIDRRMPEYQYPWFRFYRASLFPASCRMLHHLIWRPLQDHQRLSRRRPQIWQPSPSPRHRREANTHPHSSVDVNITGHHRHYGCRRRRRCPRRPLSRALDDDADNGGAGNTSVQVAVMTVISNAAKSSLRAYFEGVNWPLNKALPKGAEFLNCPLGDIMRQFCLVKTQVAHQLLNYKKRRFVNTHVSILLNPSNIDETLREGMAMSTPGEFVSSTLLRICNPDPWRWCIHPRRHVGVSSSLGDGY